MQQPGRVERLWWPRLRWRMRGAWQWPAFAVLTPLDALLLLELPPFAGGPRGLWGALLLAGFANLLLVGLVAPVVGLRLRRVRPDLPRGVASDYAGAFALLGLTAVLLVAGLLHRPAAAAERADVAAVVAAAHEYVRGAEPEYADGLATMDARRLEEDYYRACIPGPDPDRWLCLFVSTDQRPAGVTRDSDSVPNLR
jgi:hypothetical protein